MSSCDSFPLATPALCSPLVACASALKCCAQIRLRLQDYDHVTEFVWEPTVLCEHENCEIVSQISYLVDLCMWILVIHFFTVQY